MDYQTVTGEFCGFKITALQRKLRSSILLFTSTLVEECLQEDFFLMKNNNAYFNWNSPVCEIIAAF